MWIKKACFGIVIFAILVSFVAYPLLPELIPVHWGMSGEADSFGPAWEGAFLFPIVMVIVLLIFVLIPKVAVFEKNLKSFEKEYWILGLVLEAFFLVFFAMTLAPNFGFELNMNAPIILLMGVLFIVMGFLMPTFKRNYFVGIKTPWTLSSDKVWDATHKLGGKLFIAAGIVSLISLVVPEYSILVSIAVILVAAIGAVVYSFYIFSKTAHKK